MQQWFIERNGAKIKLSATREIWKYKNIQASSRVIQKYDKLVLSYAKNWPIIVAWNWIHSLLINIEELLEITLMSGRTQEWIHPISILKWCQFKTIFWICSYRAPSLKCFLNGLLMLEKQTTILDKEKDARWRQKVIKPSLALVLFSLVSWFQVSTSPDEFILVSNLLLLFG